MKAYVAILVLLLGSACDNSNARLAACNSQFKRMSEINDEMSKIVDGLTMDTAKCASTLARMENTALNCVDTLAKCSGKLLACNESGRSSL